ncbi:hypothetical protein RHMOL_Rhmol09G0014900 [Rhododendron molle]|uniref:Uncharacterized protein n=1 Tax=Rhododendron molle TaxID=49168 RepID=A0ACC0M9R1_RHOML|nr:hypothetical protein RHMOL_Rhmol09G0014900 [Rhododendron molle]
MYFRRENALLITIVIFVFISSHVRVGAVRVLSKDFAGENHLEAYPSMYENAKLTMACWLERLASGPSPKEFSNPYDDLPVSNHSKSTKDKSVEEQLRAPLIFSKPLHTHKLPPLSLSKICQLQCRTTSSQSFWPESLLGLPYRCSYTAKTAVVKPICVVASTVIEELVMPIAAQGAKRALAVVLLLIQLSGGH